MGKLVKILCYIEEYQNSRGVLSARLRDKDSDKIVILSGHNVNKSHFLNFLSQAKTHHDIMPTIYERNGFDSVAIRGCIVTTTSTYIEVNIDIETGGYLFE